MSETGGRDEQWKVAAETREALRGNKPNELEAHSHTGLVGDEQIRELLSFLATNYDPHKAAEQYDELSPGDMPATVEDTRLFQMLLENASTETLTRAIHSNDPVTLSSSIGDPGSQSDVSGLNAIDKLTGPNLLGARAPIIYIMGEPGSGKTSFSLLMSQLWKKENPDGELLSNIAGWKESDHWVPTFGKLKEIISQNVEEDDNGGITQSEDSTPMLFVFDEANQAASGRGADGHEAAEKLGKLTYLIRKYNCGIIIIGHDGRDITPTVRELATVVQRYRNNVKKATIWESIRNREPRGKVAELTGIPDTDYTYDDKEATSWDWTMEESQEDKQEKKIERKAEEKAQSKLVEQKLSMAAQLAEDQGMDKSERVRFAADMYDEDEFDASQRDIAEALDVTQAAISRKLKEL